MPSRERSSAAAAFKVLARSQVPLGMVAVALFFMGQFVLFIYLRPLLETVTGVSVSALSLMLLGLGLAGSRNLVDRPAAQALSLWAAHCKSAAMAVIAAGLIAFGSSTIAVAILLGF